MTPAIGKRGRRRLFLLGAALAGLTSGRLRTASNYGLARLSASGLATKEIMPGILMQLDLNDWLQRLYYLGEIDHGAFALLKKYVPVGATVIDVGAHVGMYTCLIARHVGRTGTVIAFEPMPDCVTQLRRNIVLGNLHNVEIWPVAVSNKTGRVNLYVPPAHPGGPSGATKVHNPGRWNRIASVEAVTLDGCFRGDRLDFVKIDVEGHEARVLEGALDLVTCFRPVILCEVSQATAAEVLEIMRPHGYGAFAVMANGALDPLAQLPARAWFDILLLPE